MKIFDIFLIFAQNIDCVCLRAKIRKKCYPCKPQFYYTKVGYKGYTLHRLVIMMIRTTVKFLNFGTPENFIEIHLKCKKRGQTFQYFIKKIQME